jgi:hypothetical protein
MSGERDANKVLIFSCTSKKTHSFFFGNVIVFNLTCIYICLKSQLSTIFCAFRSLPCDSNAELKYTLKNFCQHRCLIISVYQFTFCVACIIPGDQTVCFPSLKQTLETRIKQKPS